MSLHRRTFAFAALAALGVTAGLASAPASAAPTPLPAFTCNTPQTQRTANLICRTSDNRGWHDSGRDARWRDTDRGWNGHRWDGDRRGRGPGWQEPSNHGPFPPYAGQPGWPRRGGLSGPPF